jgi:putative ABC transport system permease protein
MQGNVDTGLLMIGILGGLTMLLSAFLVTNVMSAVIAQQVPIIGVLKALGGDRGLIFRQYGRMVLLFGMLALILAVPVGLAGAWFQSSYLAGQLNYDIPSFGLPWQTVVIQIVGALLVPALAAFGPVRSAANMTIREALGGQGIGALTRGGPLTRLEGVPRLFALALRNVARRKVRLFLTLLGLSLAGAMFMATFGLRSGLIEAIEILVGGFPYDVIVDLAEPASKERVLQEAAGIEGIERIEAWGVADARRVYANGRVSGSFTLFGVPESTGIATFANRAGRWLNEAELPSGTELYINYETEKLTARPEVDSDLELKLNSIREQTARLVGISLRPFEANAYMPYSTFEQATGMHDQIGRLVIYMEGDDTTRQAAVSAELVDRYEAAGMPVLRAETAGGQRDGYRKQFDTLVVLLMSLAGLTAVVGGLGLANTMALNVLERAREIGILRSMGAGRSLLRRLVLAEGLAFALISWVLAVLLAWPLTIALDRVMGNSLLGNPLSFAFSVPAALGWLALVVVIGLAACWLPAEGAARMTIREALAYE